MAPLLKQSEYRVAFEQLFGHGDSAAASYVALRHGLAAFFQSRGGEDPESLVDVVMDRLFRKVADGLEVINPQPYAYAIARNVLKEALRRSSLRVPISSIEDVIRSDWFDQVEEQERLEQRERLLGKCLGELSPHDRALLIDYYSYEKRDRLRNRKALASKLGITENTLRVHVYRLRRRLEHALETNGRANREDIK